MTVCDVKQIGCADVCPIPNTHGPIKRLFPVVFARQAPVQKSHVKRSLIFPAAVVFGILWVATPIALHAQDQHAFKIARIGDARLAHLQYESHETCWVHGYTTFGGAPPRTPLRW